MSCVTALLRLTFAARLRMLRHEYGLTVNDVATSAAILPQTISAFEHGTAFPHLTTLLKLADRFYCTLDFLLGRHGESSKFDDLIYKNSLHEWILFGMTLEPWERDIVQARHRYGVRQVPPGTLVVSRYEA